MMLHDQIFPDTYLNGREMIARLGEETSAFGLVDKSGEVLGYIYVEAYPEFFDGSIEFLGVNPSIRGEGVGNALLATGLQWLFSFETIEVISLCVNSNHSQAIHMYKKMGFVVEHELTLYEKNI
ncbi:GNAT family N-acetyltransferase [Virgibacillus halophilus]|uniref:GNAT family N-acetyltransferase n=2 Tax=Tigheibacillus halophilus TaxID=361280 RepID=A0ABU5CBD5_9BACI|nr:GNAT family N-acetyltransferase [Virgibacillus halophilus]